MCPRFLSTEAMVELRSIKAKDVLLKLTAEKDMGHRLIQLKEQAMLAR